MTTMISYTGDIMRDADTMPIAPNLRAINPEAKTFTVELQKDLGLKSRQRSNTTSTINTVISNLVLGYSYDKAISYTSNRNRYSDCSFYGRYNDFTHRTVTETIYKLNENNLIEISPGYFDRCNPDNNRWSTAKLTRCGADCFRGISTLEYIRDKHNEIEIRDGKRQAITELRNQVLKVNRHMKQYKITCRIQTKDKHYDGSDNEYRTPHGTHATTILRLSSRITDVKVLLDSKLHRVFNVDLRHGGRWYASWQNMPRRNRKYIKIDGESTTELDYSAHHLRILYNKMGLAAPDDPYDWGLNLPRPHLKVITLIAINAKNRVSAIGAINNEIYQRNTNALDELNGISAEDLLDFFNRVHEPIKEYFLTGYGLRLQYLDSILMCDILDAAVEDDVPIMPLHDSCLTTESSRGWLMNKMMDLYQQRFGFEPIVAEK